MKTVLHSEQQKTARIGDYLVESPYLFESLCFTDSDLRESHISVWRRHDHWSTELDARIRKTHPNFRLILEELHDLEHIRRYTRYYADQHKVIYLPNATDNQKHRPTPCIPADPEPLKAGHPLQGCGRLIVNIPEAPESSVERLDGR